MNRPHGLRLIGSSLIAALCVIGSSAAIAASYIPYGPQNDVDVSMVLSSGWTTIYQDNYADNADVSDVFSGAGEYIMLASRFAGSDDFDLLAVIETSAFVGLQTGLNETLTANGAEWYKNGYSMGFAALGDTINQSSADTSGVNPDSRMSWHTNWTGYSGRQNPADPAYWLSQGWRSGANTGIYSGTNWERYVLTYTEMPPVPVPASLPLLITASGTLLYLRRTRKA